LPDLQNTKVEMLLMVFSALTALGLAVFLRRDANQEVDRPALFDPEQVQKVQARLEELQTNLLAIGR
jgi:hypothetical protein